MDNIEKSSNILTGILSVDFTQRFTERTFRIFSDANQLSDLASKWKNVAADKAQGHMFEQLEVLKFNFDALKKDSDLFAKTTASMGLNTDPVDIIISNGKRTIREVQAKSCNTAARSAFSLSDQKYQEMLRLSPSDQHDKIEELLNKRIAAGTLKAEDYQQTLRNLKKSLEHDNVRSSGTTYQEALDATSQETADKIASNFKINAALTDMHESGKRGGAIGAGISATGSLLFESFSVYQGERTVGEATVNVAIASAKGFATGYTVTAISKGITHASSQFLGEQVARGLTRSNAPVAIAAGVVNASKSIVSFLNGEIDSEQLADEISHTAITSTSSFYYGALGQAVIPIPVVGAMVGATVGYFIGNLIHQSGLIALGDSAVVKEAKERREQIQAMCIAAIPEIRKNRLELEQTLELHFADRKAVFISSFEEIDSALVEWDPDKFLKNLNAINSQFGSVLPFKNFEEFDQLMLSDKSFEF